MVFSNEQLGEPALLATQFDSYRVQVGSLTLLAVHPTAPVLPQAWRRDHDLIRAEAVEKDADLIVGDMNATPDHDVMRELDDAGFRDAGELANNGWQPTWPANHVGHLPAAAAAGPDRPRAARRHAGLARHPHRRHRRHRPPGPGRDRRPALTPGRA